MNDAGVLGNATANRRNIVKESPTSRVSREHPVEDGSGEVLDVVGTPVMPAGRVLGVTPYYGSVYITPAAQVRSDPLR